MYRENAIAKCFETAKELGHRIFALQDGGQCFTEEPGLGLSYEKYGQSSDCSGDGEGGPMANDVYAIINCQYIIILSNYSIQYS